MDLATILGLVIGIGGILLGNMIEGGHTASLVQGAAAMIVLTGTAGAVMVSSKSRDIELGIQLLKKAFLKDDMTEAKKVYAELIECAKLAKKETPLAIESRLKDMRDPFLKNVMQNVVDAVDPKIVTSVFEQIIDMEEKSLNNGAKIWADAGGFAPTIGIIGAVLGLIHVMGNLSDTSKLGAGIAVAFVATIYGVGFANLIFIPISNKLKKKISSQIRIKEMVLEGGLAISAGLSPSLIEIRLKPFMEEE